MVGSEIVTYTGIRFDIKNFDISSICIEDIAHGLSFICRYSGQCKTFYSVGEHSINCYKVACDLGYSSELKLYTLLHDATEAYLYDIPTPIKKRLPEYKKSESILENMIYNRFGLNNISIDDKEKVKTIDNFVFNKEWFELMDKSYFHDYDKKFIPGLIFEYRDFSIVEKDFLEKAKILIDDINRR